MKYRIKKVTKGSDVRYFPEYLKPAYRYEIEEWVDITSPTFMGGYYTILDAKFKIQDHKNSLVEEVVDYIYHVDFKNIGGENEGLAECYEAEE